MIFAVSAFKNSRLRKKSLRSSSVWGAIFSREALIPLSRGISEELANQDLLTGR
jgi:hypothetical protein